MAAKKRIPPRPTPPAPKPSGSRKSSPKKPGSGGFGRAEDQIIRAGSSVVNIAGKSIRTVASDVDKAVNSVGRFISGALSGGGPGAGSFGSSKPAPNKKPSTTPKGPSASQRGNWVGGKWIPPTKPSTTPISGGKIAKVVNPGSPQAAAERLLQRRNNPGSPQAAAERLLQRRKKFPKIPRTM